MSSAKPNVHAVSNVLDVKAPEGWIDFFLNPDFVRRIVDRDVLCMVVKMCGGPTSDIRVMVDYAEKHVPGIQAWQLRRIEEPDECPFCDGEKPWGCIITNGIYREVCKCDRHDCRYFDECHQRREPEDAREP